MEGIIGGLEEEAPLEVIGHQFDWIIVLEKKEDSSCGRGTKRRCKISYWSLLSHLNRELNCLCVTKFV